jgi:hypothetical protein
MQITTVISTALDSTKRLLVKVRRFGKSDIQTPYQSNPFGLDSNPIKGMKAVYSATDESGKNVIVGYLNSDQLSEVGETRLYSTDSIGAVKTYVWIKNDGTIEIGGNADYAVLFNKLKIEFNKLKTNFNNHITEYNTHTHLGVQAGSGVTGITTPSTNNNTSNIDNAKNSNVKM